VLASVKDALPRRCRTFRTRTRQRPRGRTSLAWCSSCCSSVSGGLHPSYTPITLPGKYCMALPPFVMPSPLSTLTTSGKGQVFNPASEIGKLDAEISVVRLGQGATSPTTGIFLPSRLTGLHFYKNYDIIRGDNLDLRFRRGGLILGIES
jgi:hypothetical protein